MFTSLSIRYFRCFEELCFDGSLDRVNLIAGTNSVGKTTLLEAVYLLIGMGNAALVQRLVASRGLEGSFGGDPEQFNELLWEPLFFNLISSQAIEFSGTRTDGKHVARLTVDRARSTQVALQNGGVDGNGAGLESITIYGDVLRLSHEKPNGSTIESAMMFAAREGKAGIVIEPAPPAPTFRGAYRATNLTRGFEEDAARYTRLESEGEPHDLLNALKIVESRLTRIRVAAVAGASMLRGDIGIGRMVPLPLLGGGLSSLASILLMIADCRGGVVLIDEIENGFRHSLLGRVWAAIGEAARRYDTQVFATTHSFECIEAAHEAFREDKEYAFRLHRLERTADESHVITYGQETLAAALRSNLEVR